MASSNNKFILISFVALFLTGGYLLWKVSSLENKDNKSSTLGRAVSYADGKQIIEIIAKAGYSPSTVFAEANNDTVLRVITDSTFDCSSALMIPKLGIKKNLPPTATTDIFLGSQAAGTKLAGTCAMGMYNFSIVFN